MELPSDQRLVFDPRIFCHCSTNSLSNQRLRSSQEFGLVARELQLVFSLEFKSDYDVLNLANSGSINVEKTFNR